MLYRSNFFVGVQTPGMIMNLLTFNPELICIPFVPRQHCMAVCGNVFAGGLAILVGLN